MAAKRGIFRRQTLGAALLGTSMLASPAFAEETAADDRAGPTQGVEDIIVTAEKRSASVQNVPIAVTALTGEALRDRNITDPSGLIGLVPNLGFNQAVGETRIAIRGITFENIQATGAEARVAFHVDSVYVSRPGNISSTFFDVERLEVLRGPQGTLFGRNAIAGAVNLITRNPENAFGGYVQVDAGNYDAITVEGAVSVPLSDSVSLRFAGRSADRDGYGTNVFTGNDIDDLHERSFRVKLKFEPSSTFRTILSADYSRLRAASSYYYGGPAYDYSFAPLGGQYSASDNPRDIYTDLDPLRTAKYYGFSAESTLELSGNISLVSLAAYRHGREFLLTDNDYTQLPIIGPATYGTKSRQFSEELRLQGDYDWGNFLIGAYYFQERYLAASQVVINASIFGGPDVAIDALRYGGLLKTKSYAAFAQATFDVTDQLHITAGARFTKDKKSRENAYFQFDLAAIGPYVPPTCRLPCGGMDGVLPIYVQPFARKTWDNFSPRLTVQYDLSPDANIYATFSKGFKSGAFQPGLDTFGNGVNPEKLTNYEAGIKADILNRRLRANVAGFYYDYKNLQVFRVLDAVVGAVLQNAASARLYGVEAEITAVPTDNLQIDLAGGLMKGEFTEFEAVDPTRPGAGIVDLKGNRLPSAPKYTLNVGVQYKIQSPIGDFTLRGESQSQSKIYFDQYENDRAASKAYTTFNAFLNWESNDSNLYGGLYIRNIGNVFRFAGGVTGNDFYGAPFQTNFIPPRTYGAKFGVRF